MAAGTLVDSNVLLDVLTEDKRWFDWSGRALAGAAEAGPLFVNPVIYAEVSVRFNRIEDLDDALGGDYRRLALPWEASFLAGKAFLTYRRRNKGTKASTLPDFFIGAHAAVAELGLLTRDVSRYRTYFPTVRLIGPR